MRKLGLLLIAIIFSLQGQCQTDPDHPNVLLIIADDLGLDYMNGFQDNNLMPVTPHLDSLRESGVGFSRTWSTPKCSPSRAAIMSGKFGIKTGVQDAETLDTAYVSLFREIEAATGGLYTDAVLGKWHISSGQPSDHPNQHGIDYYNGFWKADVEDYYDWPNIDNDGNSNQNTTYATEHFTTEAIDWINDQNSPWFMWLAHAAPHSPFHVPPAGTYSQSPTNNNKQKYVAAIESMDYQIGRLLDNIPQDVEENTVIIFIGDNGTPGAILQNYPTGHGKSTLYQGGVAVPMIISGQGVTRINEIDDSPLHTNDLFATILEITGADLNGGMHNSLSFKGLLTDAETITRDYVYTEFRTGWTIRDDQYKLIVNEDCTYEFFDLINDSLEVNDLIDNLTASQEDIRDILEMEGEQIRKNWSCQDLVQNGAEIAIDCGGSCAPCPGQSDFDCKEDLLVVCDDIMVDSIVYASQEIESSHKIETESVAFHAAECIELTAGFDSGSQNFEATIEDCDISGIGDADCTSSNITSQTNIGCCEDPFDNFSYVETVSGGKRLIATNDLPNHEYCTPNNPPTEKDYNFEMDEVPVLLCEKTSILRPLNRPDYFFGVALNGVLLAPSPAEPFIFEDVNTGEYNWFWVFEPTNVQGNGMGFVKLDCSSGHAGNQGYHYHGNMFQYVEEIIQAGLSTQTTPPAEAVQVGWAADGFPILYRFGPDEDGNLALLQSSYELKFGNRPGDGITAPCGSYNGRYTNDYRYVDCSGDLDECNGVEREITLETITGPQTFPYFYVITDDFPQIPRCFSGAPDASFK